MVAAAKIGPRISCAPSASAERAASAAPPVASVSRTISATSLPPTSNSAICAACSMPWPSEALLPLSGSNRPTRIGAPGVVGVVATNGPLGSTEVDGPLACPLPAVGGTL